MKKQVIYYIKYITSSPRMTVATVFTISLNWCLASATINELILLGNAKYVYSYKQCMYVCT